MNYRFFIAGIIQGSIRDHSVYDQSYRYIIKNALSEAFPDSRILCPVENHPESPSYDDEKARSVFIHNLNEVNKSHALVVYIPEASMGSAIEMWEAYNHKRVVITISPMKTNWIVRLFSDKVFKDTEAFATFVQTGSMADLLNERYGKT